MMGLSRTTLWTSWYIHFMILSLFPVCIGPFSIYYHFLSRHNSDVGDIWWTTLSPTSLSSIMILWKLIQATIILCAKISPNGAILQFSSPGIIFIYLFIWAQSLITLGFLISTWFKESAFRRNVQNVFEMFKMSSIMLIKDIKCDSSNVYCVYLQLLSPIFRAKHVSKSRKSSAIALQGGFQNDYRIGFSLVN